MKNRDISYGILTLTGFIMIFPLIMMVTGSFLGPEELRESYGVVLEETSGPITLKLIPDFPTFRSYVELLLDSPDFCHVLEFLQTGISDLNRSNGGRNTGCMGICQV